MFSAIHLKDNSKADGHLSGVHTLYGPLMKTGADPCYRIAPDGRIGIHFNFAGTCLKIQRLFISNKKRCQQRTNYKNKN